LFPYLCDCFRYPNSGDDKPDRNCKREEIHLHSVFVVVRVLALIIVEIFDRSVGWPEATGTCRPARRCTATRLEWDHMILIIVLVVV